MSARGYQAVVVSLVLVLFVSELSNASESNRQERIDKAERALRSGDLRTAEESFRALIAEDGEALPLRLELSATLLKEKRLSEAFEQASIVLNREKESAQAHALIGSVYRLSGEFRKAIAHYHASLQIEDNAMAAGGLAIIDLFKTGSSLRVYGAAGIEDNITTRLLPQLSIGSCVRQNVLAAVLDLESISDSAGFRQTGILGGNFLSQFRVVFDLNHSVVKLVAAQRPAMAGK